MQIYSQIRDGVIFGFLPPGYHLTDTRQLAKTLGVGRITVLNAYEKLKSEDLIVSRLGSGYLVNPSFIPISQKTMNDKGLLPRQYKVSFSDLNTKISYQISQMWYKFLSDELKNFSFADIKENYTFRGINQLLQTIRAYVFNYAHIVCDPRALVIGNAIEYALEIVVALTKGHIQKVAIGNLNDKRIMNFFAKRGVEVIGYYAIDEDTLESFNAQNVDAVFITPSHLHDLGEILSYEKRRLLMTWVHAKNHRYIIENDYCREYVFGNALMSLKAMDGDDDRVFYLNSFSRTLGSDLRTNYLIVPKTMETLLEEEYWYRSCSNPFITQWLIYRFMETGNYERLIRVEKKKMLIDQAYMINVFKKNFQDRVTFYGTQSGQSICVSFKTKLSNSRLVSLLKDQGVRVSFTDDLFAEEKKVGNSLVFNGSALERWQIDYGIALIKETFGPYLD
jgi:GntR family transcriptional regulator/MocR family aminotransferase